MTEKQTIDLTKVRVAAPWAAWWAMFSAVVVGVWYLRGAKEIGEQVVAEVKELRAEMRQTRDTMHLHDVRISTLEEWRRSQR